MSPEAADYAKKQTGADVQVGCAIALVVLLLLGWAGCHFMCNTAERSAERRRENHAGSGGQVRGTLVTRAEVGDDWPLTVDAGRVECQEGVFAVFHANGQTYALNGAAKARLLTGYGSTKAYRDIEEIWADNPDFPGTKKLITPILDRALSLCR